MKRFTPGKNIIVSILILITVGCAVYLYNWLQRPHVRYLTHMSGLTTPSNSRMTEQSVTVKDKSVPFRLYRSMTKTSDRYYLLVHGFTPNAHKHPRLHLMAQAICDSTGMNVIIPEIRSFLHVGVIGPGMAITDLTGFYTTIKSKYPGRYRVFGACIGATVLTMAMRNVPAEEYPEKMLLYGPLINGRGVLEFYNNILKVKKPDLILKLVITSGMDAFSDSEKALIRKAIMKSGTGRTDELKMKKILGQKLFHDISVIKLSNKKFEAFDVRSQLGGAGGNAACEYFIMHAKNDSIIPFEQGKDFFQFLKGSGRPVKFIGTELFSHSENTITVTGIFHEIKYMLAFFDELFRGDIAREPSSGTTSLK